MPMLTLVESSARADVHGLADDALQARREHDRVLFAHVAREDRELVATEARDDVARPQLRGDALAQHDQELVARAVPQAVVDGLEAVAVEEQHREAEARVLARRRDRTDKLLEEIRAVRQVGEVVVMRDVLQASLGDPARGDVQHLEDEAGRVLVGGREERCVQRDRDEPAVGARAAELQRAGGRRAGQQALELGREGRVIVAVNEGAEIETHQLIGRAPEDLAQRGIRLQHDAIVGDQRHADGSVRERLLEPALALLQLGQVARSVGGFALGRGDALLLRELGVLDVPQVQAVRQDDAADDGQRGEEDTHAQALVADEQQRGNGRACEVDQRHPPVFAQDHPWPKRLALLQRDQRGHEERLRRVVRDREREQAAGR